jgi:transcriptional regulator of acetoin/glycerol metabolism
MPRALQARLLRVLAEREVLPIGATRPVAVNIRVIAATHADLEQRVREGRFRDDLYYRLNGAHLAAAAAARAQRPGLDDRPPAAAAARPPARRSWARGTRLLLAHRWPGNLRELRNALDYARSVAGPGPIELSDLPDGLRAAAPRGHKAAEPAAGSREAALLLEQLRAAHWNVSSAARSLGVSRMTLYRRMKRWGIASPNQLDDPLLH